MGKRSNLRITATLLLGCLAAAGLSITARAADDLGRCGEHLYGYNPMKRYVLGVEFDEKSRFAKEEDALLRGLEDAIDKTPDRPSRTFNVLVLSGGGQWGAYGAGFLHGWANLTDAHLAGVPNPEDRVRREDIDIVTGVSTGAMQTTLAFAGSLAHDVKGEAAATLRKRATEELSRSYTNPDIAKLVQKRSFSLIWKHDAMYDVTGLEAAVRKGISDYFKVYSEDTRQRAYVGLVNVDRNEFFVADLKGIGRSATIAPTGASQDAVKRACLSEIILGSAAIPVGFPPRFIDKHMFVDGGARHALFGTILLTRPRVKAKLEARNLKPYVHVIINGNQNANTYGKDRAKTENSFFPIIKASMRNVLDQLYKDAVYRNENDLKTAFGANYSSRYAFVPNSDIRNSKHAQCIATVNEQSEDVFDPTFMGCLHKIGVDHGHAQKWVKYGAVPAGGGNDDEVEEDVDENAVEEK